MWYGLKKDGQECLESKHNAAPLQILMRRKCSFTPLILALLFDSSLDIVICNNDNHNCLRSVLYTIYHPW